MERVYFLSESGWRSACEDKEWDIVVVGSGPCGLAVAERALHIEGTRVLMIERGEMFLPDHFQSLPPPYAAIVGPGLSETFPWAIASSTSAREDGIVTWLHGAVSFFGGRSTLWSAWCPRPTAAEMAGWPPETIEAALAHFEDAERLMHVIKTDSNLVWDSYIGATIDSRATIMHHAGKPHISDLETQPLPRQDFKRGLPQVYGSLQSRIQNLLREGQARIPGVYRTQAAPLACGDDESGFRKFATPAPLLSLLQAHAGRFAIATDVTVSRILAPSGVAVALETTRGVLSLGKAALVLAMGTLPPTALLANSFPALSHRFGTKFGAHITSCIVARVPRADLETKGGTIGDLEMGACYVAGLVTPGDYSHQFHIQLSAVADSDPAKHSSTALRYMPDVVASATATQLAVSRGHVIFVCAVLGEMDDVRSCFQSTRSELRETAGSTIACDICPTDVSETANLGSESTLRIVTSGQTDAATWNAMDAAAYAALEGVLSPRGSAAVEYWHAGPTSDNPDAGEFKVGRPLQSQVRLSAAVHECSTLHMGSDDGSPVGLDYSVKGCKGVYVTGGALWPRAGSCSPTLTMVALAQDLVDKLKTGKHRGFL